MPWSEKRGLSFGLEVFNVTHSMRFDSNDLSSSGGSESNNSIGVGQRFGNYSHLITNPRVMQSGVNSVLTRCLGEINARYFLTSSSQRRRRQPGDTT